MSVSDFLFQGAPPASVKTYGVSAKDTPAWYSDYTQGLIAKANAIASEPYQQYQYPRIAGFNDTQNQAFKLGSEAATSYQPALEMAGQSIGSATQSTGLDAANPYFAQASKTIPQGIGDYMNPYTDKVVDRIGDMAKRQLSENVIPTIQNQFIGGGSFGGSRSGEALAKGMRDLQESTLAQQTQALQQGYTQAGQQFTADQNRLAQLGQASGTLQSQDLNRMLEAGKQYQTLGSLQQGLGLNAAAALEGIGGQQQMLDQKSLDLAYQDFVAQRDRPMDMISFLNQAVRGLDIPSRTTSESTGPAQAYQPSILSQAASAGLSYAGLKKAGVVS
jgi:hypothetical protein